MLTSENIYSHIFGNRNVFNYVIFSVSGDMILNGASPPFDAYVTNSFYGSGNDYIDITRTFSMEHAVFNW